MKPLISVIIPTFNRAVLVQQAVESVLAQEGSHRFEIIVIDDGSTVQTAHALARFDGSIRYVRQDNAGLNPARNHGLRLAQGEFIALLDDDDVWLPFKTNVLLSAIARFPEAGFVHSNFFIWKPDSDSRRADGLRSWFPRRFAWEEMYSRSAALGADLASPHLANGDGLTAYAGDLYYWSLFAPMVLPSTAIIRRSVLGDSCFPEIDSVGDWEFFARLSHRSQAVFVPMETTLNRSHEDATRLTRTDPSLRVGRRIALYDRLWRPDTEFMKVHGPELEAQQAGCLRRLARLAIAAGKPEVARNALARLRRLSAPRRLSDTALWGFSHLPFASSAIALARAMRSRSPAGS